jgi:hypothetical protein
VTSAAGDDRYRLAAWTYFTYGIVYEAVALYIQLYVFPLRGSLLVWFGVGALLIAGVPWLLARRRAWFERWVLSRRDFARILAVLLLVRFLVIARIALHGPEGSRMPSFGSALPSSPLGASVMALVALVTCVMVARAAWASEQDA